MLLAAVALYLDGAQRLATERSLVAELLGGHNSQQTPVNFRLKWQRVEYTLKVQVEQGRCFRAKIGGTLEVEIGTVEPMLFCYIADGVQSVAHYARYDGTLWLDGDGAIECYQYLTYAASETVSTGYDGNILAHSDGKTVAVHVEVGGAVEKGQSLVVLEVMKVEFQLIVPVAGTVAAVNVDPGQQVKRRQLLVRIKVAE